MKNFIFGILFTIISYLVLKLFVFNSPTDAVYLDANYAFGTIEKHGQDAIKSARASGVEIPSGSKDIYFCITGFKETKKYIAYTVSPDQLSEHIRSVTEKSLEEMRALMKERPSILFNSQFGSQHSPLLFKLDGITLYTSFEVSEKVAAEISINESTSRIFICIFSTD